MTTREGPLAAINGRTPAMGLPLAEMLIADGATVAAVDLVGSLAREIDAETSRPVELARRDVSSPQDAVAAVTFHDGEDARLIHEPDLHRRRWAHSVGEVATDNRAPEHHMAHPQRGVR